jgi:hypothetical protein
MKTPKPSRSKRPNKPPTINTQSGGFLGAHFATALTRTWGPLLAFIAFIAISGLLALQFARSDSVALGMSAIVVVALVVALVGRIKNVL